MVDASVQKNYTLLASKQASKQAHSFVVLRGCDMSPEFVLLKRRSYDLSNHSYVFFRNFLCVQTAVRNNNNRKYLSEVKL